MRAAIARDLAAVGLAAELGVRLLRPRPAPPRPAPADVRAYFSAAELERGARFARPQLALSVAASAVQLSALALTTLRPPRYLRSRRDSAPLLSSAAVAAGLGLGGRVLSLPISAIARRRALAAGLATQSWRGWGIDLLKASALEAGFSAAGGAALVATMRRFPRDWWLVAAGGSIGVGAALGLLGPVLLEPIFNDFKPLAEGQTRADVFELAGAAEIPVKEVYSVDASRRTTAANAYVTGLGSSKRVVLFDTLLDRFDRDQVRVVVAHELSHVGDRDVVRGLAYAAIVAAPAARAIARVGRALGADQAGPGALPALSLASALVAAPVGAIAARLSRAIERRADQRSLELTQAPEAFIAFEQRIATQNLIDIEPPRLLQALLATHPSTAERIGAAAAFAAAPARAATPARGAAPDGRRTQAGS